MLPTIILVVLVLLVIGALPVFPHSQGWGPYPSGIGGLLVLLLVLWLFFGGGMARLHF